MIDEWDRAHWKNCILIHTWLSAMKVQGSLNKGVNKEGGQFLRFIILLYIVV